MDKSAKTNALRACRAILWKQNWTSCTHNTGTEVSDWAKREHNMHKKKLCSADMMVYAAMCMVRGIFNACV